MAQHLHLCNQEQRRARRNQPQVARAAARRLASLLTPNTRRCEPAIAAANGHPAPGNGTRGARARDLRLSVRRCLAGVRPAAARGLAHCAPVGDGDGARPRRRHSLCGRQDLILVRRLIQGYVEAIRNTPFLVQLLLIYLGLPALGLRLTPDQAALLAMVVNLGAYATEIARAGIEAVPHGQIEAGRALGLKPHQIFRFVVLVPALRTVFPALGSQFILVMLASSVVSVISAEELTAVTDTIIARNFRSFEFYFVATGIYLAMSLAFQAVFAAIERLLFSRWSTHT